MKADNSRSEQVIDAYKRRKLAVSALHRIHDFLRGEEEGRAADRRLAGYGVLLIAGLLALAAWFAFSAGSVTLS